jgi:hypothetical protein
MTPYYDLRKRIEIGLLVGLAVVTVAYGIFRAYPLVAGPSITIYSPDDGDYVASTTFEISGQVKRANSIMLQGRPITIDTEGRFKETLVAQAPHTILVLVATDSYGETVSKTVRVIPQQ